MHFVLLQECNGKIFQAGLAFTLNYSDLLSLSTQNEVARAIELREIVTSLGPAYIKLGQALSIRPDILSPTAMTELQKLCDKVTSYTRVSVVFLAPSVLVMMQLAYLEICAKD